MDRYFYKSLAGTIILFLVVIAILSGLIFVTGITGAIGVFVTITGLLCYFYEVCRKSNIINKGYKFE